MKRILLFFAIMTLLILNSNTFCQTIYDVQSKNFSFSPAQLTINVGDTVRWTNTEGTHNVVADDNLFKSGSPSSANWVYEFVFTSEGSFRYYCELHGGKGGNGMSGIINVEAVTNVTNNNIPTNKFELSQNYPNPFNPTTKINWQLPESGNAALKIYDILGNQIITLENGYKPAGNYTSIFDATNLSSGIYFYTLSSGKFIQTKKMLLIK